MNKLTEKMFGRRSARVNFIDLDKNKATIKTSGSLVGKKGQIIDYDPQKQIKALEKQGYLLVKNGFDPQDEKPSFPQTADKVAIFDILFKHGHQQVDVNHLAFGLQKADLQKQVKQTVHYKGAATRTPADSVTHVTFNHLLTFDRITGKQVADKGWSPDRRCFHLIGTPTIPGFVPDKVVVGGKSVTAEDQDLTYEVRFTLNQHPSEAQQNATIEFVDLASDNQLITTEHLTGKPNMPINYDPQSKIQELKKKGYLLVHNGFNPDNDVQFFGNATSYTPTFVITMYHTLVAVDVKHPNSNVDPYAYRRDVKFVVRYDGAGAATPEASEQTAAWTRRITAVPATGQIVAHGRFDTDWQVDRKHFSNVPVPIVPGYHTKVKMVRAPEPGQEDVIKKVNYEANGRIVPVDSKGQVIPKVKQPRFKTDPKDPTSVVADEVVPAIKGYDCDLMTVSPRDPGEDLRVTYEKKDKKDVLVIPVGNKKQDKKPEQMTQAELDEREINEAANEQAQDEPNNKSVKNKKGEGQQAAGKALTNEASERQPASQAHAVKETANEALAKRQTNEPKDQVAIINFIDIDHNGMQLTSSGPLTGKPGESINDLYSTEIPLRALHNAGYEVAFNNFDRDGFIQRFDNNDLMPQIFTIGVRKRSKAPKGNDHQEKGDDDDQDNSDKKGKPQPVKERSMVVGFAASLLYFLGLVGKKKQV